jgi:hypothetical protein
MLGTLIKRLVIVVVAVFSLVQGIWADSKPPLLDLCQKELSSKFGKWVLSSPPSDLAAYARDKKIETNIARSDFDGDGLQDFALLISTKSNEGISQYIAVCFDRKESVELHLIKDPYCGEGIKVSLKGHDFHNHETDRTERYPSNGISAYCFEKAAVPTFIKMVRFRWWWTAIDLNIYRAIKCA